MKVPNVFPVFYKVDPSDIRNQRGDFKTAFDKHEKDFKDNPEKVQRWRSTLKQVCNLSGWPLKDDRPEAEFITSIINTIWKSLNINSNVAEDFVGIDSVEKIYKLLETGSNDTRFIGIWGMGGVGKTALARVVFDSLSHKYQYDGMCFLANVREVSKQSGLTHLQEMLLSKVSNESNLKICDPYEGISYIRRLLCHKRVLVVLDDVDNQLEQLEKLAGKHNWFGSGSIIVVTARNKQVLISHGISSIYELQGLEHDDALQLFHMKAFTHEQHTDDHVELSKKIVQHAKGLPLALVLLGSSLCGRSVEEWKSALNRLRQVPNENILKQLRISYDGLEEIDKKIFLDIACFFKGKNKYRVIEILDSCDFHSTFGIGGAHR
ncbi:hypothetical protein Dsin_000740 [Dipteronia sinensis]|uniref:TIR domain-containing protein n=1 Tax=Dipteronia sinensis TaxID=43782 RepID=A0AAE0B483_9ROSI|nr:hypothetical protein Dsin_000740 [Dipteronia sinensis]